MASAFDLQLTTLTGDIEFSPVQSQFRHVSEDELTALYAASDACIVSSTRDGFNVVSLEYIACQQDRHGVLLLSEFAGAANVLDDCIKFNPWDMDEFSDAIFLALTMGEEEKRLRFDKLHSFVMANTRLAKSAGFSDTTNVDFASKRWGQLFLDALNNGTHRSKNSGRKAVLG